ncbi:hypothetical protein BDZ97DRAFT_1669960 [Flammula alnicola]|nr:hypothetical protein BDZ97DRAFT_1669960 [Flammula alnicola]
MSNILPSASKTRPRQAPRPFDYPALQVFRKWVNALRTKFAPLPPHTTSICFRLLFPEEDIRRKYDIQETRMTQLLADCFGVDLKVFEKWSLEEASGCLGQELKIVLERICPHPDGFISPISLAEVDELLDELAAKSGYSHKSVRSKFSKDHRRPRSAIIRSLFRSLSPEDASVLTQVVLKDLRPILYPLTEFHYTTALTKFNVASVKMLTKEHAMDVWDPSRTLSNFYRVRSSLDEAAAFANQSSNSSQVILPTIASPVAIPKSEKAQGCSHALELFQGSNRVWAETKYDGERAQIHVEIRADNTSYITIFSKSKRDSTHDRHAVHSIIRSALGLDSRGHLGQAKTIQNIILDAEMVAFRGEKVEEFWHIRQLIEDTAHGIRGNRRRSHLVVSAEHESMNSEANEGLNLGLVFFDVIYLNSQSLLPHTYAQRREILEGLIQIEPGKAILANRCLVDMSIKRPEDTLRRIFSEHIASHEEGLVLKAEDSRYNDYRKPWVKLKKDYIPGHGDTVDMVVLGASWEKIRGRSLRVPPTTFTTFYIGALENKKETLQKPPRAPKFHVYFTVSYGLSRFQLEELNFLIKNSDPVSYSSLNASDLPFIVTIFKGLRPPPTVILRTPLLAELFGAGFTKAAQSQHYELRFPRIVKVYRPSERSWEDGEDLESLHKIACNSVGRDRSDKDVDDVVRAMFNKPVSPGINSTVKRKARTEGWYDRLAESERKRPRYDKSPTCISKRASENSPTAQSVQRRVESSIRKDSQPLTSKTNIENISASNPSTVPDKAKYTLQLTVPRSPITPSRRPPSIQIQDHHPS